MIHVTERIIVPVRGRLVELTHTHLVAAAPPWTPPGAAVRPSRPFFIRVQKTHQCEKRLAPHVQGAPRQIRSAQQVQPHHKVASTLCRAVFSEPGLCIHLNREAHADELRRILINYASLQPSEEIECCIQVYEANPEVTREDIAERVLGDHRLAWRIHPLTWGTAQSFGLGGLIGPVPPDEKDELLPKHYLLRAVHDPTAARLQEEAPQGNKDEVQNAHSFGNRLRSLFDNLNPGGNRPTDPIAYLHDERRQS